MTHRPVSIPNNVARVQLQISDLNAESNIKFQFGKDLHKNLRVIWLSSLNTMSVSHGNTTMAKANPKPNTNTTSLPRSPMRCFGAY